MPFTIARAQSDAIGPAGGIEVWLEVTRDATTPAGQDGVCVLTIDPKPRYGDGDRLVVPIPQLDAFVVALQSAITEGRRAGILPPPEPGR